MNDVLKDGVVYRDGKPIAEFASEDMLVYLEDVEKIKPKELIRLRDEYKKERR